MRSDAGDNLIVKLTFDFSVRVIRYVSAMNPAFRHTIGQQLLKSATSVGANVREAQIAESLSDFVHKFKIAAKEADESEYWLMLCCQIDEIGNCRELLEMCGSIIRVLSKIIASTKLNMKKR